jgi:hypothetical protein
MVCTGSGQELMHIMKKMANNQMPESFTTDLLPVLTIPVTNTAYPPSFRVRTSECLKIIDYSPSPKATADKDDQRLTNFGPYFNTILCE